MKANPEKSLAMRVSVMTIVINVALSAFKLFAGIAAHSGAMISDAIHSASDVLSTLIVMAGIHIAGKDSDEDHQYGHERWECVAAFLLAVLLFAVGLGIGYSGVQKIFMAPSNLLQAPGVLALAAAVLSIGVKEWMYWYTRFAAKKINSGALLADAWHHRSDALSSVGSFIGIAGARMGFPLLDPVASVVICLFILKAAYDIAQDAIFKMVDKACDEKTIEEMRAVILAQEELLSLDQLKTRLFGSKIYVDIEISANGEFSLRHAHTIAEKVHNAIEANFPDVKHCMVHVNPK